MKKVIGLLTFIISLSVYGNNSDSMKIVTLQKEVSILKSNISGLQQEEITLRNLYQQQTKELDSLRTNQRQQAVNVRTLADKVGADILDANQKIDNNISTLYDSIKSRSWFGVIGILIAIVLLVCTYYILKRKISYEVTSIEKIKAAQESLESAQKAIHEESVKLDNKFVELLDKQVSVQPQEVGNEQPDHSLALKVADEIVRIETNLSRMDASVKGYKQLAKAVERIRTNFMANGYEIVEMLGKPYNEGMKVVANFVSDDTLAEGEQIITGIIKPQINYKGKMIQSAQITVSQNI